MIRMQGKLPSQLHTVVETHYDTGSISSVQALSGGEWKDIFRLNTAAGTFVLSVSHPTTVQAGIAYEHALLRYLHAHIPEVPAPIESRDGGTHILVDDRIVTLLPLMPGRRPDRRSPAVREAAARMLARIHRTALDFPVTGPRPGQPALRDLDWHTNHHWSWPDIWSLLSPDRASATGAALRFWEAGGIYAAQIAARREQIAHAHAYFERWVAELARSGRPLLFAPTHGDYFAGNLLMDGGRITGVIDWDECRHDWLAFELGRATWEFCRDATDSNLDTDAARTFVTAYQADGGPIPSEELDLLVPFMRSVRIFEVLFVLQGVLNGEEWSPDHAEYHLRNLIGLDNLEHLRPFESG